MIIDTDVHFWKYDKKGEAWITENMAILKSDFLPQYFSATAKRNDIDAVVAVQSSQSEIGTRFLIELSKTHPIIQAVVGWIDLGNEDIYEKLDFFLQYPVIKGWSYDLQQVADDFLPGKNFQRVIGHLQSLGYCCNLLINHDQLAAVTQFFSMFPQLKCVVNHCARPDIRHNNIDEWRFLIKELAKYPNVYCNVSGLFTEAAWKQWSAPDFYPYLDVVFHAFGTDRLMYGSDWPMILLSGLIVQWKSLLEKYMENFSKEQKERIFGLNAIKFYNL